LFYTRADELQHGFAPERIGVMAEFPAPASFQLSFNPGYVQRPAGVCFAASGLQRQADLSP
jgi:hypothetical protein